MKKNNNKKIKKNGREQSGGKRKEKGTVKLCVASCQNTGDSLSDAEDGLPSNNYEVTRIGLGSNTSPAVLNVEGIYVQVPL